MLVMSAALKMAGANLAASERPLRDSQSRFSFSTWASTFGLVAPGHIRVGGRMVNGRILLDHLRLLENRHEAGPRSDQCTVPVEKSWS